MRTLGVLAAASAAAALACSSSTPTLDGGADASSNAPVADAAPDVTYSCDVSALSPSALACPKWSGIPTVAPEAGSPLGTMECPIAPAPWNNSGNLLARICVYTWGGAGPPDVCTLPIDEGRPPFTWLAPACK